MLGHVGINVTDLAVAKDYYDRLLPALGFDEFLSRSDEFAYRPAGGKPGTYLFFYPASAGWSGPGVDPSEVRHRPGLQHLAFMVPTRAAVSAAHRLALSLGSDSVHGPQDWPQYPPPYHAAFWLDPFGVMLEAVCHHDR